MYFKSVSEWWCMYLLMLKISALFFFTPCKSFYFLLVFDKVCDLKVMYKISILHFINLFVVPVSTSPSSHLPCSAEFRGSWFICFIENKMRIWKWTSRAWTLVLLVDIMMILLVADTGVDCHSYIWIVLRTRQHLKRDCHQRLKISP